MSEHARLPVPGLLWGDHPERRLSARSAGERARAALRALADSWRDTADTWLRPGHAAWLARFRAAEASVQSVDEQALLQSLRAELVRKGLAPEVVLRALALAARVAERCLGVRPFDSQLIAARAVLDGRLAEMATGEGKTLAVALAAATAAISGMPIHVVTANDYLVTRDASHLAPFYSALGLTVGAIVQADDPAARARAYGCNVTYVTAKELVFDYLRDRLSGTRDGALRGRRDALAAPLVRLARSRGEARTTRLLRGLCMAIVDEADAILIDEARVPLILSLPADAEDGQASALQSLQLARALQEGTDFTLDHTLRTAELTRRGREKLEATAATLLAAWRNRLHREHAVCMALAALHLFQRERHYLVRDDGIAIIDETTGRVAAGRAWSDGLQQLIEAKEGCEPSAPLATLSQLTYQRFFPRYFRMGGVSGTLSEARFELMLSYGLSVQRIPQRRPCRRIVGPTRLFASHAELWRAVSSGWRSCTAPDGRCWWPPIRWPRRRRWASNCCAMDCRMPNSMPATIMRKRASSHRPASAAPSPSPPTWPGVVPTSCWGPKWMNAPGCTSSAASSTALAALTGSLPAARPGRAMQARSKSGCHSTRLCWRGRYRLSSGRCFGDVPVPCLPGACAGWHACRSAAKSGASVGSASD